MLLARFKNAGEQLMIRVPTPTTQSMRKGHRPGEMGSAKPFVAVEYLHPCELVFGFGFGFGFGFRFGLELEFGFGFGLPA